MSEPAILRLKRKATDEAPNVLVLEPRSKRAATNIHYVRKPDELETSVAQTQARVQQDVQTPSHRDEGEAKHRTEPVKRLFHLNRKRKGEDESVATFEEKRYKSDPHAAPADESAPRSETPSPTEPLKKPSKRAAVQNTNKLVQDVETDADRKRMEELANYMHEAALEEIKRERKTTKPVTATPPAQRVATPKLSGQRSRDLHRQRVVTNGTVTTSKDIEMTDDSDYVYDTYILAPASDLGAAQVDIQGGLDNAGYLVITEEDESLWETYLEDEPSEKDWNSEDEDENAEDFYGADYPEDELASDDEFDRNAYEYRGAGASDEEEWDGDAGVYSDEEEFEGVTNPLKHGAMPKQFANWK